MSFKAQQRYIDRSSGRIILSKLVQDAEILPRRFRTWNLFKEKFNNLSIYTYNFEGYNIEINIKYAFNHFTKNTYNEQRSPLNGVLYDILHEPLIVIKHYDRVKKRNSLQFYKPYKKEAELYHMMMFQVLEDDNGIYRYKTLYDVRTSLHKVSDVIKEMDLNTVYFKYERE
jgi:hypothetical protein